MDQVLTATFLELDNTVCRESDARDTPQVRRAINLWAKGFTTWQIVERLRIEDCVVTETIVDRWIMREKFGPW